MRIQPSARHQPGFTFWELLIVIAVLAMGACVAWVVMPRFNTRSRAPRITCLNNLKQVGIAFRGWAIDNGDKFPMQMDAANGGTKGAKFAYQHFQLLSNELGSPNLLICPADQERIKAADFTNGLDNSHLSYFVNLDADNTNASALAGDRNLTMDGVPTGTGLVTFLPQSTIGWTRKLHVTQGNLLLSDGSVQAPSSSNFNLSLKFSGVLTNRLLIP